MGAAVMVVKCMCCGKWLREKPSFGSSTETSGICESCLDLHYPQYAERVRGLRGEL
jgi:hypothetical protein